MLQEISQSQQTRDYDLADYCKEYISGEHFVGIEFSEEHNHPIIRLPLGFPSPRQLSSSQLRNGISLLIRVILRVKKEINEQLEDKDGKDVVDYPFDAYRRMILDYVNHGFIREPERKESRTGNGRIDWAKTLRKSQPLWTEKGPVHLNPIRVNTIYSHQELMEIQKYCLMLADLQVGWLFGRNIPVKQQWSQAKLVWARNKVNSYKRQTYDGRISKVLRSMSVILSHQMDLNESRKTEGNYKIALEGNSNVGRMWEIMIDGIFGSNEQWKYRPLAIWNFDGEIRDASSSLELDSIRFDEMDQKMYCTVIDAKYHTSFPSTSDINKQITYGEWVAKKHELDGENYIVNNLFILPRKIHQFPHHEYLGYATMDILEDQNKPYHKVHAKGVDTMTLMRLYLQNDKSISEGFFDFLRQDL